MQSNHKDDAVEHDGDDGSRAAPGWEDDASLEDIETVIEPDQQEMQQQINSEEALNRSISANDQQVDDVLNELSQQKQDDDTLEREKALVTSMLEEMKLATFGQTRNSE